MIEIVNVVLIIFAIVGIIALIYDIILFVGCMKDYIKDKKEENERINRT